MKRGYAAGKIFRFLFLLFVFIDLHFPGFFRDVVADILFVRTVHAAPFYALPPSIAINAPAIVLLGGNFSFSVTFDNASTSDIGYGPLIDLILPTNGADGAQNTNPPLDGLGFVSATYLGVPVENTVLTFPGSGGVTCVSHPYLVDNSGMPVQVCGNAGDTLVALRLPFGSFTPDQPPAEVQVTVSMSNLADVGAPLTIQARGGYQFGYTPTNDYTTDPPNAALSGWVSASVKPTLLILSKAYSGPEDETTSGPNFARRYAITAETAPGQTLSAFTLTDTLPVNMQFVSLVSTSPGGATCTLPSTSTPGGTLSCNFGPVSGTVSMTFSYYIPLRDADGNLVIDPSTGDDVLSCNNASATYTWTPADPRDTGGNFTESSVGCEHTLTDKSIAIQKSVGVVDGGQVRPGAVLEYTLDFQISDFFAFDNVVITDIISDGQRLDASFTPTLEVNGNPYTLSALGFAAANYDVTCNYTGGPGTECTANDLSPDDGTTTLTFRVSDEVIARGQNGKLIGGCVPTTGTGGGDPSCSSYNDGPTTGRIVFRTIVQRDFSDDYPSGDPSVDQGDVLSNTVRINGALLSTTDAFTSTGNVEDDTSAAQVSIGRGNLSKSIYAVNGSTTFSTPVAVKPGDTVTYRLTYTLPITRFEDLMLTDYLPLPVFDASEFASFSNTTCGIPAPGYACLGPSDTYFALPGATTPVITVSTVNNSISGNWGDYDHTPPVSSIIDILFTFTVSNAPFADRLYLTNQANAREGSTNSSDFTANAIVQIILNEPVLKITKGAIWTSNTVTGAFNPTTPGPVTFLSPANSPRWSGTINSTGLSSNPINSNISGVDAGDIVTFALVFENTGHSDAFDIRLRDDLPAHFIIPSSGLNLQVYRGDGAVLSYTDLGGGLFGSGIEIVDPSGGGAARACQTFSGSMCTDATGQNIVVVIFDLEIAATVPAGAQIINTATLFNYAGTEGGPDHTASDLTDQAITQARYAGLGKTFTTEIINSYNSRTQVVIGEFVDYTLTITVPEGTMTNVTLEDTLPAGLAFVDCLSVTASTDLTTTLSGGFSAACNDPTNPSVSSPGQNFTFTLGTIANANRDNGVDEVITITFRTVVLNVSSNQAGTTRRNSATLRIDGGASGTAIVQSSDLTVIEPQITTTKSVSPTVADAGDTVTFTITLSNPASSSTTAYDVIWSDTVPPGLSYVSGSLTLGTCTASTPPTLDANGAPILIGSGGLFHPGQSCTITFQAVVGYSVTPGQSITNTAEVRWTSLLGDVQDRSSYNSDSDERTGADGPGGVLNDYASQGSAVLTINDTMPVKALVATSEAHTSGVSGTERVTIGEIVRYRLVVQLPEGTSPNFQIRDNLPSGLTYLDDGTVRLALLSNEAPIASSEPSGSTLGLALGSGSFGTGPWVNGNDPNLVTPTYILPDQNVGSSAFLTADPDAYGSGTDPFFKLGTLTNNDNDADAEYVIIEFNALVNNISGNDAGITRSNTFSVFINSVQNGPNSNPVQVVLAEPSLSLTKAVSTVPTDAGDLIKYTLTISTASGANTATAFDLNLTDTFDDNLTGLTVSSVVTTQGTTCTGNGNGVTAFSHNGGVFTGNTLTFTATCLDPGKTITITVSGTVVGNAPAGYVIPNIANLTWTSLPGPQGTASNPTGSGTPGSSGTDNGERDGSGGIINDYATSGSANTPLAGPQIQKQAPTPTGYPIGATVIYPIRITLPEGVARNVRASDAVPAGMQYVSYSLDTTGYNGTITGATVTCAGTCSSGDDVTFDFGNITTTADNDPSNNAFTLYVTLRVLDVPGNSIGTVLTNGASLAYTPGTGNADAAVGGGTQDIIVLEPIITTSKSVITPSSGVQAGDTVTYTVRFTNTGTATAYDVTAEDILAQGVTYNNDAACTFFNGTGRTSVPVTVTIGAGTLTFDGNPSGAWDIPATDPDSYIECTYSVTAQTSLYLDGNHTNTVDADWSSLDGSDANERVYNDSVNRPGVDGAQDTASAIFTSPAPTFDKSGNATNLPIGATYHITLTLTSPLGTLHNLTITDTLPAGLIYVVGSQSVSSGISPVPTFTVSSPNDGSAPVTLTWTFGDAVISSSPITVEYDALVANVSSNQNLVVLTNQARLDYTDANNTAKSLTDTDNITVIEPELDVQKTVNDNTPGYGQTLTYTLTVSHLKTSTATAYDIVITDTIPSGLTYVGGSISAPAGCTANDAAAPTLTWTCASLEVGDTFTLAYQATVTTTSPPNPGETLTNNVSMTWTSLDGADLNERGGSGGVNDYSDGTSTSVVITSPDLTISKTDSSDTYVPGSPVSYTIVVRNVGNGDALNAVVSDTRPTQILSWTWTCTDSSGGASGCDGYSGNGDFSDTVNLPAGLTITYTVSVQTDPAATTNLVNMVTVTLPTGITDPTPDNNIATDTDAPTPQADLSVTKDDGVTVIAPGSLITYTVTVRNLGPSDANEVTIRDPIPSQISTWDWSCTATGGATCNGSGGPISTDFGDTVSMPAGSTITYIVWAQVSTRASGSMLTNSIEVQPPSGVTDANDTNNTDDDIDHIIATPSGDLIKRLIDTGQEFTSGTNVAIGEILTYEVSFTVPANSTMSNLTLTDILDHGLAFVECLGVAPSGSDITTSLPGGFNDACDPPVNPAVAKEPDGSPDMADLARKVTFSLGDVSNAGDSVGTVTIRYRAVVVDNLENQDGLTLGNRVVLRWTSGELSASAPGVTIVEPDLELIKEADKTVAFPGAVITFTLTLQHTSASSTDAFDVTLFDRLPPQLSYVPGSLRIVQGPSGGVVDDSAAPDLRVYWGTFPKGAERYRTQAIVEFKAMLGNLQPGQKTTNVAHLEWSSLPGDYHTPQSRFNPLATERYYDPGDEINNYGLSAKIEINVPKLPTTGFTPGLVTQIPQQKSSDLYHSINDLWLEVPALGLNVPIVGVPAQGTDWNLTWLWGQAGWLEGSAFPTWNGNAVITAHVFLPDGTPGPFYNLGKLRWGDQIIVHLQGQRYVYEVRQVYDVTPFSLSPLRHESLPWITLITCKDYDPLTNTYRSRLVVRAVLVKVY